jgi:hypothetical protein
MVNQTTTITVDRISNSGNAIAQQEYAGRTIHVPAGIVGREYDVRLVDEGSFFRAQIVGRTGTIQPPQPGIKPDTSRIADGLLERTGREKHEFAIRRSPKGGKLRSTLDDGVGRQMRSAVTRKKH